MKSFMGDMPRIPSVRPKGFHEKEVLIENKDLGFLTIDEQCDWEWGKFDLPEGKYRIYYNPTVSKTSSRTILWVRKMQIYREERKDFVHKLPWFTLNGDKQGVGWYRNSIEAYDISDVNNPRYLGYELEKEFEYEQMEDPRVLVDNDKYLVTCASYVGDYSHTNLKMYILDMEGEYLESRMIEYGGNPISVCHDTGVHEKNWTFFIHNSKKYFVYYPTPHTVVEVDSNWEGVVNEYVTDKIEWEYGEPRGGTNPVLHDGQFWSFFHSSCQINGRYLYGMGWYSFESEPPFKITGMSKEFLLSGNWAENRHPYIHNDWAVVFPGGAYIEDGVWTIIFGFNDCECRWVKIPHKDLV